MLRLMGLDGVAVIVSRWFGGTLLGPDRFKFICNSARQLLLETEIGTTTIVGSALMDENKKNKASNHHKAFKKK